MFFGERELIAERPVEPAWLVLVPVRIALEGWKQKRFRMLVSSRGIEACDL